MFFIEMLNVFVMLPLSGGSRAHLLLLERGEDGIRSCSYKYFIFAEAKITEGQMRNRKQMGGCLQILRGGVCKTAPASLLSAQILHCQTWSRDRFVPP